MTYAGAYGRNERIPVDRLLCREDAHPLGIRRDDELSTRRHEVTALAAAEADEAATANKKWTFGVAAGALLMAGTFAAGALGITGGAAPLAGAAPEHAPAAPGHASGPVISAPAPGQDDRRQAPKQQDPRLEETQPSSASPKDGTTDRDLSSPTGESARTGGGGTAGGSGGGSGGGVDTPAPQQPAPQQPAPQQPAPQQQQGPLGQVLTPVVDTADDILSPVTGTVGGLLGVSSADQSTQRTATPSGPALTMINPLGDLLGG